MENLGYIEAVIKTEDAAKFTQLVNEVCRAEDFYLSEIIPRINGDVTSKLHLTFLYGIVDEKIDRAEVDAKLAALDIKTLKLGKLFLKNGYKGEYQILMVEVIDEDGKLATTAKSFNSFDQNPFNRYEFRPHITLAYVQPTFLLKGEFDYPKEVAIEQIKYNK